MKIVVFDIDGTLTQTNDADTDCFVRALKDCFALNDIETDWSGYTHSTDAGIMKELSFRDTSNEIHPMLKYTICRIALCAICTS